MTYFFKPLFVALTTALCVGAPLLSHAQKKPTPSAKSASNALAAIREADLKRDLFALAADKYRGREGGTLDELRASTWLAEQIRAIGLLPAGDDGTYFQWFNLQRTRLSKVSRVSIGAFIMSQTSSRWYALTAGCSASVTPTAHLSHQYGLCSAWV